MGSRQSHPAGARALLPIRFWLRGGVALPRSGVQLRALPPLLSPGVLSPLGVREAWRLISAFALQAESDAGSATLPCRCPGGGRMVAVLPGPGGDSAEPLPCRAATLGHSQGVRAQSRPVLRVGCAPVQSHDVGPTLGAAVAVVHRSGGFCALAARAACPGVGAGSCGGILGAGSCQRW